MSDEDRERWEKTYATASDVSLEPRPTIRWLDTAAVRGAVALDVACGRGRHVPALSALGYRVIAADISRHALTDVARMPPRAALVQIDTDAWPFRAACFDVVVQVDFLDRRLLPTLRKSVKPGGVILIDTFAGPGGENVTGPRRSEFRLEYGELDRRFADWELVQSIELPAPHARAAMLARRPRDSLR